MHAVETPVAVAVGVVVAAEGVAVVVAAAAEGVVAEGVALGDPWLMVSWETFILGFRRGSLLTCKRYVLPTSVSTHPPGPPQERLLFK